MGTVRDMLQRSLREAKVVALGEPPTNDEMQDALATFVDMMDAWSAESLVVPGNTAQVFTLVPGQAAYTLGVGGNFNTARPARIESAYLRMPQASSQNQIDLPITVSEDPDEYASITIKNVQSSYPWFLYDDNATPIKTITFWPVPTVANQVVLWTSDIISAASSLDTVLNVQPGYNDAIMTNLAVRLANRNGQEPAAYLTAWAKSAYALIKRSNYTAKQLTVDPGIGGNNSPYNIYGDYVTGQPFGGNS